MSDKPPRSGHNNVSGRFAAAAKLPGRGVLALREEQRKVEMDAVIPPPPAKMYNMAVEFLAEREGVTKTQIMRDALDALIASKGVTDEELERWQAARDQETKPQLQPSRRCTRHGRRRGRRERQPAQDGPQGQERHPGAPAGPVRASGVGSGDERIG